MAQLALNALRTPVVEAVDGTTNITTTVGGATTQVVSGKVVYKVTASRDAYAQAISAVEGSDQTTVNGIQGFVIELGEKLYDGKLQLRENGVNNAVVYDDFGRPARRWQYDGTTFGTYAKKEDLRKEYTTKVTGKDLYDELGADLIKQYTVNVSIDGETDRSILDRDGDGYYFTDASMIRTNTWAVGGTGNGVLTQVYVDSVHHILDIAIINTYLAKASQDYNAKDNDVDLKVYKIDNHGSLQNPQYVKCEGPSDDGNTDETITVKGEDFDIVDVKDGDFFLVNVADGEIQVLAKPEVVSEVTLNAFKQGDWVKNSDVQYDYASTARYDVEVLDNYDQSNMQSVTYNAYLDQYGYLVGLELNEELNQYLFLTGIDLGGSNLSAKNASANVIMLDGTMQTVTVNVEKSEKATDPDSKGYTVTGGSDDFEDIATGDDWSQVNTWCTYTVDANGVYTLKQVGERSNARADGIKGAKKIAQSVMSVTNDGQTLGVDNSPASTVALDSGKLEISSKQVRLNGSKAANNTSKGDFAFVYGNEDTVYINVDMKGVTAKDSSKRAIVDKVNTVTTGVKNVNISVSNLSNTAGDLAGYILPGGTTVSDNISNEVYVLYKDNGYVIGVVTLAAEDEGTTNNWAYIIGDVKQEEHVGNNEWRWSKEAIINGKLVTLTEVDDSLDILADDKTVKGNWYSLRFDKDGNVASIKKETGTTDKITFDFAPNDKFVVSVDQVYPATAGLTYGGQTYAKNDSVLLYADYRCNAPGHGGPGLREMKFEAGTLYTDRTNSGEGFQLDPNANIVVLLSETHGDGKKFNTKTDGFTGWDGMKDAIKELESETSDGWSEFDGILTVVFNKGVATSVILDSRSGKGNQKPQEPVRPMQLTITKIDADTGATLGTEVIDWTGSALSGLTAPTGYNYASDSGVTFREGQTGSVTIRYKATGAMQVMIRWMNSTTPVKTEIVSITDGGADATKADGTLTLATSAGATVDYVVTIPTGYELTSAGMPAPQFFDAGQRATIDIAVQPRTVSSIAISGTIASTDVLYDGNYTVADAFAAGMVVTATMSSGDPVVINNASSAEDKALVTFTAAAGSTSNVTAHGTKTIQVNYGGQNANLSAPVKVYANVTVNLSGDLNATDWAVSAPDKIYTDNLTGIEVKVEQKEAADATISNESMTLTGGTVTGTTITPTPTNGVQASNTKGAVAATFGLDALTGNAVAITVSADVA